MTHDHDKCPEEEGTMQQERESLGEVALRGVFLEGSSEEVTFVLRPE